MKKTISLLIAAILLMTAFAVSAKPAEKATVFPESETHLEGYVVGDGAEQTGAKWVGFSPDDPENAEIYTFHLTTYGAAFYNGVVYGYVYGYEEDGTFHDEFYTIDIETRIPNYHEGSHSGEIVYGMAYDYTENVMYALVNDDAPRLATVDLETGALTDVCSIQLGSYLGVYGLAIDLEGNMYCMTLSAISGRLVKVNKQTGALTELVASGMPCYYAQCITYDAATNKIYWAEVDGPNTSTNGLYSFDIANNYALNYHGVIGTNYELMAMYSTAKPSTEPPAVTPGDVNLDGVIGLDDALLALRHAMSISMLEGDGLLAADFNGDGSVSMDDALMILRKAMDLI